MTQFNNFIEMLREAVPFQTVGFTGMPPYLSKQWHSIFIRDNGKEARFDFDDNGALEKVSLKDHAP